MRACFFSLRSQSFRLPGSLLFLHLVSSACGSPFRATPSSNAGSAGEAALGGTAAGGAENGADAGESASAGDSTLSGGAPSMGGNAASAGSGGKPMVTCNCAAGSYCQDGTTTCHLCSNFARLNFTEAEKLASLSHAPQSSERFPRVGPGSTLFYSEGSGDQQRLWYASAPLSGVGSSISTAARSESGPLLAPGYLMQSNFFFDRLEIATGKRKIMMSNWSGSALSDPMLAPAPINMVGVDDYSPAVAPSAARVYWMSTRNGMPQLFSYENGATIPAAPVALDVQITVGTKTCPWAGDDATPWVNLAGTLLLFRSQSLDENCEANDSGAYDLFAVPLGADGAPIRAAVPLTSLNSTGGMSNETDASLSTDLCTIYFASDSGSGDYDLYRATRN